MDDIDKLVESAQSGDPEMLTRLVRYIQDDVFHLSMRMLVNPQHAEDATQEILILVITKLSTFKGESRFKSWVYRVGMNYLISNKKVIDRELGLNFDLFGQDLESGLADEQNARADDIVMLNELRVACTMAMLLCLDLKHRAAYILGEILEFTHGEAADILQISSDNYRKRLSRAKSAVQDFTQKSCGLVNDNAACICPKRLPFALDSGRIGPDQYYSSGAPSYESVRMEAAALAQDLRTLKLQRATPQFSSPKDFGLFVTQFVEQRNAKH